ncbi:MAG: PHP domain-containing protein [Clostridiales Family XIII bacterium]|jgi:putative hydrolase|nr:PHP domain-containing protein [Clostridiales Family XIII bacterium]
MKEGFNSMEKVEYMINNKRYSLISDLHTHTRFSHGTGSVEDNVTAARARGIMKIGITDHGPGHLLFGVRRRNIPKMRAEVERLGALYTDMEILLGVEANISNNSGALDIKPSEFKYFDYITAGYHYAAVGANPLSGAIKAVQNAAEHKSGIDTKGLVRRNTRNIVRALERNSIKILTHPGDKAPVDLLEIAVVCAKTETLVEINTAHMSLSSEDIRTMALADVSFIIGSDAHSPGRVGDFVSAVSIALDAGIDMSRIVNLRIA